MKTKISENSEKFRHLVDCPIEKSEYFEVFGKCYFTDKIKRNFDDSQAHCKKIFPLGGRLFEPRDEATNEEVVKVESKIHGSNLAWIGIIDRISQGSHRYSSDNGQLTLSQWGSGEPGGGTERCVRTCSHHSSGNWCDYECSGQWYHLCERTY